VYHVSPIFITHSSGPLRKTTHDVTILQKQVISKTTHVILCCPHPSPYIEIPTHQRYCISYQCSSRYTVLMQFPPLQRVLFFANSPFDTVGSPTFNLNHSHRGVRPDPDWTHPQGRLVAKGYTSEGFFPTSIFSVICCPGLVSFWYITPRHLFGP